MAGDWRRVWTLRWTEFRGRVENGEPVLQDHSMYYEVWEVWAAEILRDVFERQAGTTHVFLVFFFGGGLRGCALARKENPFMTNEI